MVELRRRYTFEAAHFLPRVPETHPCARMHGHTYAVEVALRGDIDSPSGWLIDYADIDQAVRPVIDQLDHRLLNEIEGLDNPTSEILARWCWTRTAGQLPGLASVSISENPDSSCVFYGSESN